MHHGEAPRAGPWRRAGRCVRSTGSRVRGGHRIDIHPRKAPSGRRSYERSIVDGKTQGARARLATAARREEPGVRAREAARKLCTSETELLASACGTSAVRFDANFGAGPSALGARSAHRRGGTSAHAMIELTGGINALRGFSGYRPVSPEALAPARPEVLPIPKPVLRDGRRAGGPAPARHRADVRGAPAAAGRDGWSVPPGLRAAPRRGHHR